MSYRNIGRNIACYITGSVSIYINTINKVFTFLCEVNIKLADQNNSNGSTIFYKILHCQISSSSVYRLSSCVMHKDRQTAGGGVQSHKNIHKWSVNNSDWTEGWYVSGGACWCQQACPVKYQKASCVFNLQALPANPNSQPPRGGPGGMHNGLCSRWERDGGRVFGALKLEPLARGVNPNRKS
jgi:hypothetical protein